MSAGLGTNPPESILPDNECHDPGSETAWASHRPFEEHERKVMALRHALIEGENSGQAEAMDMEKIKATARQRASS